MKETSKRLWLAFLWIALSVASLFISVVSYAQPDGQRTSYAIQDLVDGERFSKEVLYQYTGKLKIGMGTWVLTLLCVLGVAAIVAALVGIAIMSRQKPVKWPYVLTVFGVVGTAIPAALILLATLISVGAFPGTIVPGVYPIVTPLAVILCLIIVVRERKRVRRAHAAMKQNVFIRRGGDLY